MLVTSKARRSVKTAKKSKKLTSKPMLKVQPLLRIPPGPNV
jgi:hypothetical protein